MTLVTNDNFQRLVTHLKAQGEAACLRSESTDEYQRFIQKFPLAQLPHLRLDQYCVGKGDGASFCWWIEQGLIPALGRYMPGTSRGHILYFLGDGTLYKNRRLLELNDEEALRYTLKIQSAIAGADPSDLRWVDDDKEIYRCAGVEPRVTVGNGRKLRLLACYLPAQTLPISSSDHLGHYLKALGCADENIPSVNKPVARMLKLREYYALACESVPGLSPYGFMRGLYSNELGLAPVKADQADDDEQDTSSPYVEASKEAMQMDLQGVPLNQILFGPPGTGKTHATVDHALAILDPDLLSSCQDDIEHGRKRLKSRFDELVQQDRIRFVTFHQSFSYEDFVEGLRAESDDDSGQLRYEVVDGVFKSLCEAAAAKVTRQAEAPTELDQRRIWKMSLGNTLGEDASIYQECLAGGYVLLGYGDAIDFAGCSNRQQVQARFADAGVVPANPATDYGITSVTAFVAKMKVGDLIVVSDGNFKFRAIGEVTDDYQFKPHAEFEEGYAQLRPVKWLRQYQPSLPHTELLNGQFSQMTLYELREPTLNREKLKALLGAPEATAGALLHVGQRFGQGYVVRSVGQDVVEFDKPRGGVLPLPLSLLRHLLAYVRSGQIDVEDIRQGRVFEKIAEAEIEKYIINGYQSLFAAMVEQLIKPQAESATTDARVLIIDEINRGNISRIFGELITLIEPSKRAGADEALSVMLPYSKQPFSVPNNLFLIGTMNTSDRSLAGLDIALRRRFVFREMPPRPELLDGLLVENAVDVGQMLRVMNQRIEVLLDRDHCLGHAYFMPLKTGNSLARLELIFRNQIVPLLQEYFFEDWQRIGWVLNDQQAGANGTEPFIRRPQSELNLVGLFGSAVAEKLNDQRWELNHQAFSSLASYQNIVG